MSSDPLQEFTDSAGVTKALALIRDDSANAETLDAKLVSELRIAGLIYTVRWDDGQLRGHLKDRGHRALERNA